MANLKDTGNEAKENFEGIESLVGNINNRLSESYDNMDRFNSSLKEGVDLSDDLVTASEQHMFNVKKESDLRQLANKAAANRKKLEQEAVNLTEKAAQAIKDGNKVDQKRYQVMASQAKKAAAGAGKLEEGFDQAAGKAKVLEKMLEIGAGTIDAMFTGLMKADEETAMMAKNMNMTKSEANSLRGEMASVAFNSNEIAITTRRLAEAFEQLNNQLGTAQNFSMTTVGTFSKLTKLVGVSAEAAGNLAFAAERNGANFREVEENVLATSHELQRGAGIALNMQGILEATGKVTGQLRAQLGGNPELIAEAVTKAKLLGAEINDIVGASKTLLQFESSIESELEAELLTGKQLNLERARAAALAGDQATVAEELAKNMGTFTDFTKMNTLQQDALAKSMGMQSDQLSDILFKQETMGMNAKQLRAFGKDELADRLEHVSAQEKLNLAQEKLQSTLSDVAAVALPIVDGFANFVNYIAESKLLLGALVGILSTLAIMSVVNSIASIFTSFAMIGPIGIPLALGAVAGLTAAISKGKSSVKMAQGGIVKPKPGGTLATIGEAGQAEAVVPLNKAKQMGFGGGESAQPVIIQNNWDAFAASNGRGRKGLGGTQNLQASPTFA